MIFCFEAWRHQNRPTRLCWLSGVRWATISSCRLFKLENQFKDNDSTFFHLHLRCGFPSGDLIFWPVCGSNDINKNISRLFKEGQNRLNVLFQGQFGFVSSAIANTSFMFTMYYLFPYCLPGFEPKTNCFFAGKQPRQLSECLRVADTSF